MDYFNIMRNFWDYCFENPDKIRPIHIAVYCFAVEHCNRLGWKERFGFPTMMVCEAIGIKSVTTYSKALDELEKMKLIKVVEKSKNQWSANVIALSIFDKANNKALDKARGKHVSKHMESTPIGTVSIIRPNTSKQVDKKEPSHFLNSILKDYPEIKPEFQIRGKGLVEVNTLKSIILNLCKANKLGEDEARWYYNKLDDAGYFSRKGFPMKVSEMIEDFSDLAKRGWIKKMSEREFKEIHG
jgi:hypothetical protein